MDKETRLKAREGRKVKSYTNLITPFPISNAVFGENVSGLVLSYLFPCKGKLVKGVVKIEDKLKDGAEITIKLTTKALNVSKAYTTETKEITVKPDLVINSGDCLEVSISPKNSQEVITKCWMSFLWYPNSSEVIKEKYEDSEENE